MINLKSFVSAFCLLSSVSYAQVPNLPITFAAPKSWEMLSSKEQNGATLILYRFNVSDTSASDSIPSNALVTAYKLQDGIRFEDADQIVTRKVRDSTLIVSGNEKGPWKTYIFVNYEKNRQLIIFYRIGFVDGYGVEVSLLALSLAGPI